MEGIAELGAMAASSFLAGIILSCRERTKSCVRPVLVMSLMFRAPADSHQLTARCSVSWSASPRACRGASTPSDNALALICPSCAL